MELKGFPREFIVVDIETTGLDPETAQIVEIYALKVRDWEPVDEFYSMCYTETIPEGAMRVHGIRPEETWSWPTEEQVMRQFFEWLGDSMIVGHYVGFEARFFRDRSRKLLGKKFDNLALCTLELFRVFKENREWIFQEVYCGNSLEWAVSWFGIPHGQLHRAKEDAWATFHLLKELLSCKDVMEYTEEYILSAIELKEQLRRWTEGSP